MLPNPLAERERRSGREGFVQYMLASLMLGQQPPADNTPATPSGRGEAFLYALHRHVLGQQLSPPLTFVNQLRLEGVDERGNGWADHGVLSPDHATVVELKTDPGSIREGQVDWYLELALHQYPGRAVSLLYVTRDPVATAPPALPDRASYANTTWQDIARLIAEHWQDEHDSWSHAVAIMFADYLREQIRPAPDGPDLRRGSRQPESRGPPQAPAGLSADIEVTGRPMLPDLNRTSRGCGGCCATGRRASPGRLGRSRPTPPSTSGRATLSRTRRTASCAPTTTASWLSTPMLAFSCPAQDARRIRAGRQEGRI